MYMSYESRTQYDTKKMCLLLNVPTCSQVINKPKYNTLHSWESISNVSFGFVYSVYQSDTCLLGGGTAPSKISQIAR